MCCLPTRVFRHWPDDVSQIRLQKERGRKIEREEERTKDRRD